MGNEKLQESDGSKNPRGTESNSRWKNCVCVGSNENCCWCSGTGFVMRDFSLPHYFDVCHFTPPPPYDAKPQFQSEAPRVKYPPYSWAAHCAVKHPQPPKPPAPIFRCPYCRLPGDFAFLQKHVWIAHPQAMGLQFPKVNAQRQRKPASVFRKCPVCYAKVRKLHRHLEGCHGSELSPAGVQGKAGGKRLGSSMVLCPQCHAKVRMDRLIKHLRRVHPAPAPTESRTKSSLPARVADIPIETDPVQDDQTRIERRLDATRDYAHAYREYGRFGSHPSHDDFGDDGNA
jgi:hypothetical protein